MTNSNIPRPLLRHLLCDGLVADSEHGPILQHLHAHDIDLERVAFVGCSGTCVPPQPRPDVRSARRDYRPRPGPFRVFASMAERRLLAGAIGRKYALEFYHGERLLIEDGNRAGIGRIDEAATELRRNWNAVRILQTGNLAVM